MPIVRVFASSRNLLAGGLPQLRQTRMSPLASRAPVSVAPLRVNAASRPWVPVMAPAPIPIERLIPSYTLTPPIAVPSAAAPAALVETPEPIAARPLRRLPGVLLGNLG